MSLAQSWDSALNVVKKNKHKNILIGWISRTWNIYVVITPILSCPVDGELVTPVHFRFQWCIFHKNYRSFLMNHLHSLPPRLDSVDMQSPGIQGRKRGRPRLHAVPMKMAVHNLFPAPTGSLPVVKIPKKRGRKPGYKVSNLSDCFCDYFSLCLGHISCWN